MKPWIKRSLMAFTGISIAVGGLAACGSHGHHTRGPMSAEKMAEVRGKVIERVTSKLDLNAEQQQKLNVLADKLQAQRTALRGATDPRAAMQGLFAGSKLDQAGAKKLIAEKTAAIQTGSPEVIAAAADFFDNLRPEQQQKVREFMERGRRWGHRG